MARQQFSLRCSSQSCPNGFLAGFQLPTAKISAPGSAERRSCNCAVGGAGPLLHELSVAGSHTGLG